MKKNFNLISGSLSLLMAISLIIASCSTSDSAKANGWYLTEDGKQTTGNPIVTIQDFSTLEIDTLNMNGTIHYELDAQMKPEAAEKFAECTEKNVGKILGFVYQDEIIFRPIIHQRINNGNSTIASSILSDNKKEIIDMYENLKKIMNE